MSLYDPLFDKMMLEAIAVARSKNIKIYTLAFYYSHEDYAVSICIDDFLSSQKSVLESKRWSAEWFLKGYRAGDLEAANTFSGGAGTVRNLSLGDFTLVNLSWNEVSRPNNYKKLSLAMMSAIERNFELILAQSVSVENLVFCCSGKDDEVQYVWPALAFSNEL